MRCFGESEVCRRRMISAKKRERSFFQRIGWCTGKRRQRPNLSESAFPGGVPGLPAHSGVHHAVHARAERDHRALLSQPEGGTCPAAQLRHFRARSAPAECVDPLVQRGALAPGVRLSEPVRIPGARSHSGGFIQREHYTKFEKHLDHALLETFPERFEPPGPRRCDSFE